LHTTFLGDIGFDSGARLLKVKWARITQWKHHVDPPLIQDMAQEDGPLIHAATVSKNAWPFDNVVVSEIEVDFRSRSIGRATCSTTGARH